VPQLFVLLAGITQALAGMAWVLLLTIVVLYFCSLLAVKVFRDGLLFGGDSPEEVMDIFRSVPESIFVLFLVMDGHKSLLDPLFDAWAPSKLVFMIFVMISEWAMLSILTAVVSENMINVTEARRSELELEDREDQDRDRAKKLEDVFALMDTNRDGSVELLEFERFLKDDEMRNAFCGAASMHLMDCMHLFHILERNGAVAEKDFVEACRRESKPVSERSVMMLERRLGHLEQKISSTSLVVEGAGLAACNGTYEEDGTHNLRPLYRHREQVGPIVYFDLFWQMNDAADTGAWRYRIDGPKEAGSLELDAPKAFWVPFSAECGVAPTVRWVSTHKLDRRLEQLEGLVVETHRDMRRFMQHVSGSRF